MNKRAKVEKRISELLDGLPDDLLSEVHFVAQLVQSGFKREADQILDLINTTTLPKATEHLRNNPPSAEAIVLLCEVVRMELRKNRARENAYNLHSKPGGSWEKRDRIRATWASGNFSGRDECAEQECGALGMSFSAARKALRNTPQPNPWPARAMKKPSHC